MDEEKQLKRTQPRYLSCYEYEDREHLSNVECGGVSPLGRFSNVKSEARR